MTDMAKNTKNRAVETPETPAQEDRALTYARRRWAWLKANDLMLVRSLLAQGTLAEHLMETGRHAATEYQRLIVNGELPADAEKKVQALIMPAADLDALPGPMVEEIRGQIAAFESIETGFTGPERLSTVA
jgi:hypothetical protein